MSYVVEVSIDSQRDQKNSWKIVHWWLLKMIVLGCSSSSGSPMAFRAWTASFPYSFHKRLAHRILGQMDAGSDVLLCHRTREQIPMCWPTELLHNSSRSFLQSHTKGSLFHNTCFFSPIGGGIHLIWLHMQTSCAINTATTEIHLAVREEKSTSRAKCTPSWSGHLSYANWTAA